MNRAIPNPINPADPTHPGVSRRGFLAGLSGTVAALGVGVDRAGAAPSQSETPGHDAPTELDLDMIQGNILAGFSKDHLALVFVEFTSAPQGRAWLGRVSTSVASTRQVAAFNERFRAAVANGARTPVATWVNVALSHAGLVALGRPRQELARFPADFREGMRRRAEIIGDRGASDPSRWPEPYQRGFHGVVIVAADRPADLDKAIRSQRELARSHRIKVVHVQRGETRSDEPGHEHFGFRDGISQPGIRGFTQPQNPADPNQGIPGQDLLWPGEFVLGYPSQAGVGGGEEAGPLARSGPQWTTNGSYLVVRRLRQDVAGFRAFVSSVARDQGSTEDLIGAKLVGRYKSGAPLELTGAVDSDPGRVDPSLLSEDRVNDFEFEGDFDGHVVPLAAHIRKTYPRDHPTEDGGEEDTQLHRVLRRGIPFGASLPADAGPNSAQARASFPADRGLLFLCYQTSISQQFEFVQRRWVNDPDFPEAGAGRDPIISQTSRPGSFQLPGGRPDHVALMQAFVDTTGGEYFFQPSIAALSVLAKPPRAADRPRPG